MTVIQPTQKYAAARLLVELYLQSQLSPEERRLLTAAAQKVAAASATRKRKQAEH